MYLIKPLRWMKINEHNHTIRTNVIFPFAYRLERFPNAGIGQNKKWHIIRNGLLRDVTNPGYDTLKEAKQVVEGIYQKKLKRALQEITQESQAA